MYFNLNKFELFIRIYCVRIFDVHYSGSFQNWHVRFKTTNNKRRPHDSSPIHKFKPGHMIFDKNRITHVTIVRDTLNYSWNVSKHPLTWRMLKIGAFLCARIGYSLS